MASYENVHVALNSLIVNNINYDEYGFTLAILMLFLQSTPLHLAAGYNRTRIVQLLLQHGADVHAKDKGYSYLYLLNEENKITA